MSIPKIGQVYHYNNIPNELIRVIDINSNFIYYNLNDDLSKIRLSLTIDQFSRYFKLVYTDTDFINEIKDL